MTEWKELDSQMLFVFLKLGGKKLLVEKFPAKSLADFFHVCVALAGHFDVFPKAINLFFSVCTMELLSNNLHCS